MVWLGNGNKGLIGTCWPPQFRSPVSTWWQKVSAIGFVFFLLDYVNGISFSGLLPTCQQQNNFSFGFQNNVVSFLILLTFAPSPVVYSATFYLFIRITPLFCKSKRQCTALLNGIGQQGGKIIVHKNNSMLLDCIAVLHKLLLLQMQARSSRSLKRKHLTDYIP